jgi:hypothetical protein
VFIWFSVAARGGVVLVQRKLGRPALALKIHRLRTSASGGGKLLGLPGTDEALLLLGQSALQRQSLGSGGVLKRLLLGSSHVGQLAGGVGGLVAQTGGFLCTRRPERRIHLG